jgi:hypothetical protein
MPIFRIKAHQVEQVEDEGGVAATIVTIQCLKVGSTLNIGRLCELVAGQVAACDEINLSLN